MARITFPSVYVNFHLWPVSSSKSETALSCLRQYTVVPGTGSTVAHPGFEFRLCCYEAWSNHQAVCVSVSQLLSEDDEVSWASQVVQG